MEKRFDFFGGGVCPQTIKCVFRGWTQITDMKYLQITSHKKTNFFQINSLQATVFSKQHVHTSPCMHHKGA